jgi:protein O-mannosyl-transferase
MPFLWNRDGLWGLLLAAATFLAYAPSWNGQPVWDDDAHMTRSELRSAAGLCRIWTQPSSIPQYSPLVHTVFWIEHRLFGDVTFPCHLLNILLHVFSALLLVTIVRRLGIPGAAAWLAGGIFALHPVMVESVAWITELKNTLSGVFFLAAALAYLKFDSERNKKHYVIALLLFLLGLLSKSVVVTLPWALLVVFWWMRGRIVWKRDVVPLLPFFALGIISGLFTVWVERRVIGTAENQFDFPFIDRCLIAGRAVWFYVCKLLWPADLIFVYPRWRVDAAAVQQYLFPAAILLAAGIFWALRFRTRAPLATLLYFMITLFPALGFFNLSFFRFSFVADHYQYLAGIGPIVAAGAGIVQATGRLRDKLRRPLLPLVCGVLLSILFLLSWKQSGMYADAESLYRTTIRKNSGCWMAHFNLGLLFANRGRTDEAMAHYQKALELNPNYTFAHINLGVLLAGMGRTDEAMAHYQMAFELNPNHAETHNDIGILLAKMGQNDKAMVHFQKALEINPDYGDAHYDLGILLTQIGRTDEAIAHFQKALELNPHHAEAHNNLGMMLAQIGRTDQAIAHFQKALELNPYHAEAHNNLGIILTQCGRTDEAIAHYRKALEISPEAMNPLQNLAFAFVQKGLWTDATTILQNALASAKSAGDGERAKTIAQIMTQLHEAVNSSPINSKAHAQ